MMKKNRTIKEVLMREIPTGIILTIYEEKECYSTNILKAISYKLGSIITYSHVVKLLHIYLNNGILTSKTIGRTKIYQLTDKGKEIAKNLKKVESLLNGK